MKKEKTEYIADALNELEDAFVVEAATYRSDRSQKRWYRMTFAAACAAVCVILCGIHVWDQDRGKTKTNEMMEEACFAALATWKNIAWEDVLLEEREETALEQKQNFVEAENRAEQAVGSIEESVLEREETEETQETWEMLKGTIADCQLYQLEGETERYFAVLTVNLTADAIGAPYRIYIDIEKLEFFPIEFLRDAKGKDQETVERLFYVTPVTAQMGAYYEGRWFRYADVAEYILERY